METSENKPNEQAATTPFQFLIAEKNKVVVLSFVGAMTTSPEFDKCLGQLDRLDFTNIIINFRDVTSLESPAIPFLAQIKKLARKKSPLVAVCGLKPEIKDKLLSQGVISKPEVFGNVRDVLLKLANQTKEAA